MAVRVIMGKTITVDINELKVLKSTNIIIECFLNHLYQITITFTLLPLNFMDNLPPQMSEFHILSSSTNVSIISCIIFLHKCEHLLVIILGAAVRVLFKCIMPLVISHYLLLLKFCLVIFSNMFVYKCYRKVFL
jgi:hypothetical protein